MQRYAEWVIRFRVLVIALTPLVTAVLAAQVRKLEVVVDPAKVFPNDHPYVLASTQIENTFGFKYAIAIAITAKEGDAFSPTALAKMQLITAALRETPGVVKRNVLSFAARRAKSIVGTEDGIEVRPLMEHVPRNSEEPEALRRAASST